MYYSILCVLEKNKKIEILKDQIYKYKLEVLIFSAYTSVNCFVQRLWQHLGYLHPNVETSNLEIVET